MRVTAIATHPEVSPSTRFRMHQFRDALAGRGIELRYDFLFGVEEYGRLRSGGGVASRARGLTGALRARVRRLEAADLGDVVWVSRALAPIGAGRILDCLRGRGVPVVADFDDAVFLPPAGGSRWLGPLRRPGRAFADLCRASSVVLTGNSYLADAARDAVGVGEPMDVRILPTVVDTNRYRPMERATSSSLTVGWVGSHTTLPYLWARRAVFQELAREVPFALRVVSDSPPPPMPGVDVEFHRWTPATEVTAFHGIDLGVYPLPDDAWSRGKCGLKAIQYGACGVPVVASPVGVLRDVVVPEETGLWAESDPEWVEAMKRILGDPAAIESMGRNARAWIEDRYSLVSALPVLEAGLRDGARCSFGSLPVGETPCAASPGY
ncbi:MAG: glycosyltransferase family 4 protein [Gemmatimonadota bacterium]|nr:glycosyltransferase family 4 protein [Gemmatimonadota bacterium]